MNSNILFPRTEVAGISLPRMLIGTNWLLGYSHTGAAADAMIHSRHDNPMNVAEVLSAYLEYGIDAIMAPNFAEETPLRRGMHMAEEAHGKALTQIVTPIINVEDSAPGRAEAAAQIKKCAQDGGKICLLHHASVEQLVNKGKGTMDRLPDYLAMVRENGMVPGLSAHMPEVLLYADRNGYDVETYIQIYNCMGFLMQMEVETVYNVIQDAKKPVMTIKSMAAGRCTPFVGLTYNYATIRPTDMVTVGAFSAQEVHEDVEIALAAIERRRPVLGKRSSPAKTVLTETRK